MKKPLSVILTTALLLSLFTVFLVPDVAAATVINNASPAITANVGTTVNLSNYSVVFDGDTSATTSVTWKNSSNSTVTSITPSEKGVTKLTATSGSKSKTIYVIAKNTNDTEYVLYEADLSEFASIDALKTEGWTFPTSSAVYSMSGGNLNIAMSTRNTASAYLPSWLSDFGNYSFNANAKTVSVNEDTRWFSLMYRSNNRTGSYNYYQFAVRNNTTATNGLEFAEYFSGGWNVMYTAAGEYTTLADTFRNYTVKANGGIGHYIDGEQVMFSDASEISSKTKNPLTKGHLGFNVNGATLAISSVKITIQATQVVKELSLVNNRHEALDTINPIANVQKIADVSVLDSANAPGSIYINADQTSDLAAFFEKCREKQILPNLYVNDTSDVNNIVNAMNSTNFKDVTVLATDPNYLKSIRSSKNTVRTGLIITPTDYTSEHEIRVAVRSAPATFCVINVDYATKELVSEIQEYAVAVWVSVNSDVGSDQFVTEAITAATSGANGVITNSASEFAHAVNKHLVANSMTRTPIMIGHRGNPTQAPENSLSGFIEAYENGADVFELDVEITSDNQIVIMHDSTITRTTTYTGSAKVSDMTLAQIKSYKLLGLDGKATNEEVPTLKEVCEYFKDKDCKIFVEFKGENAANVPATAKLLKDYGMEYLVDVISFNSSFLIQMQSNSTGMSTGLLLSGITDATTPEKALTGLYSYLSTAQAINSTINPAKWVVDSDGNYFTTYATDRGMTVWPWTYVYSDNDSGFFSGCDGVTTDDMQWATNMSKYLESDEITLYPGEPYTGGDVYSVTYGGAKNVIPPENLIMSVVEGEEYASIVNGKLVGNKSGVAKVIFGYEASTSTGRKYVVYTQPVKVTVKGDNVALGKDYEGGKVSPVNPSYSANLTDGQANTKGAFDSTWYALYYHKDATADKITAPDGIGTIIVDLKEVIDGITDIRVHVWNSNANGILPAKSITLFVSEDGNTYTEVGQLAIPKGNAPDWATISTDNVSARYVKIVVETQGIWTFLNEIKVHADPNFVPDDDTSSDDTSSDDTSSDDTSSDDTSSDDTSSDDTSSDDTSSDDTSSDDTSSDDTSSDDTSSDDTSSDDTSSDDTSSDDTSSDDTSSDDTSSDDTSSDDTSSDDTSSDDTSSDDTSSDDTSSDDTSSDDTSSDDTSSDDTSSDDTSSDDTSSDDTSSNDTSSDDTSSDNENDGDGNDENDDTTEPELGDIDADGDIDVADYILVKRAVLKNYTLDEKQSAVADIDKDGDVDAADYVLVKRIVLGTYRAK